MKKILLIFSCCCTLGLGSLLAQEGPGLLRAEGEIPAEFITPSTTKFKKQVLALDRDSRSSRNKGRQGKRSSRKRSDKRTQKDKKEFLLQSNFAIDDMLQSGLVLFNDPVSDYLNEVLAQLPIEDAKLRKKTPRVYALNSSAVNAFATDQGIIFVTLGLLANLENEAQLAFILCHELIHVRHNHAIDQFVRSKDIDRDQARNARNMNIRTDRNLFRKSLYSRQLETEADDEGMELFLQTKYSPTSLGDLFSILYYAYLPYEDLPFPREILEGDNYRLPANRWLAEVQAIGPMEELDEEEQKKASHPSSLVRQKKVLERIATVDTTGKSDFQLGAARFREIQDLARYQIPFLELYSENFPQAIYTSALLLRQYPDDLELHKVLGKALYLEAKLRNYEVAEDQDQSKRRREFTAAIEGASQRVYHLLTEMDHRELTVLALHYNWLLREGLPESDTELDAILTDLLREFGEQFADLDDFSKTSPPPPTTAPADSTTTEVAVSKLEKIKGAAQEIAYWKYALVELLPNERFQSAYAEAREEIKEEEERVAYYQTSKGRRAYYKEEKQERKWGKQLGIDKVVVVNPFYLSLDERKGGRVQYIRSEEKQVFFQETLRELAKAQDLDAEVLDVTALRAKDIAKFNDIRELNNYFSQQMEQYDLSLTPGYHQARIDEIAEKYGTEYFLWTGVISLREESKDWIGLVFSVVIPVYLPFALLDVATPDYDMLYYAILYDVKTGRRSIIKMDYFNRRDSKQRVKMHLYDVFHQIKTRPK
ncbi:MAG: M48 family metallopeptidase [Bacteroidota bacterium]